ncbi:hypothetical protein PCASD_14997 [Puccinia coronata f. sp. avenae]|uniref:DNA replication regulator Sld3 C-terminal domain-containing protein n=1 Tax=Puccinia coronata f. sp. avenae TaxID=200324 RepID=A0A2N5SUC7_9BASI|nr:hypothetical protein PCASD_14997 [Puccinia coronata f. sp. avenae]
MTTTTREYTLGPSFECPFGWPAEPSYPIDPTPPTQEITTQKKQPSADLIHAWTQIFSSSSPDDWQHANLDLPIDHLAVLLNKIYLEALYLPETITPAKSNESSIERFAKEVRRRTEEIQVEEDQDNLVELYESFMLQEENLGRKWGTEMGKIADAYSRQYTGNNEGSSTKDDEIFMVDQDEEIFHMNEPEVFSLVLHHFFSSLFAGNSHQLHQDNHSIQENNHASHSRISFTKSDSINQQIEIWSIRETQLQIIILLELIILTNRSLDTGSQLLHKKQLSASPKKNKKHKNRVHEEESEREDTVKKENEVVVADLESLLEGLVDKLAMWQIISGIENQIGSTQASSKLNPFDSHDLDLVQRFWTDVVEEHYTRQLSLLNRSFRPKLFPTSIYDPSASSSLMPTQFDATARMSPGKMMDRTPNLKKLDRRKMARDGRENEMQARQNISPTILQLDGFLPTRRRPFARPPIAAFESHLPLQTHVTSNLLNRRQFTMSKTRSNIKSHPSHPVASKRKQSYPKHYSSNPTSFPSHTTPRKSNKPTSSRSNLISDSQLQSTVLVPDTPQTNRRII